MGAVKSYLKLRPSGAFQFSGQPLTPCQVNKTLKKCLQGLGKPKGNYLALSFSAGRTTVLVEMDHKYTVICQSEQWKLTVYLKYVWFDMFSLPRGAPVNKG